MEDWEYKADDGLILQTDPNHPYKNRSQSTKPSIPTFQYSIIPLTLATDSRHSRGALTRPRGLGFLRQNKLTVSITISGVRLRVPAYKVDLGLWGAHKIDCLLPASVIRFKKMPM
ncbi:hypothetical protein D1AOALGA4SA_9323 [Olavius algarvensis Delta 1 endosymbiont]|nr:hypothetical protein D1AOALGA4SA_9323 [Olavius algarvensis Delta 1 endosymbiont]